ncbi:MAG TPA: alpha/beta fold hydrolase [Pseudonocardiaceae bacterium]
MVRTEAVNFYSDGTLMAGDLFLPDGAGPGENDGTGERATGVVVCHGFGGIKEFFVGDIARTLAELGHVAMTFDYRGFGESEGRRHRLDPHDQVQDTLAAVEFLLTRPEVRGPRAGVYGTSFGGGVAVAAGCATDRIGAAVCGVGIADHRRWLRSLRRQWEWLEFEKRLAADRRNRVLTGESEVVEPEEIMVRDPHSMEHEAQIRAKYPNRAFTLTLADADHIMAFTPVDHVRGDLVPPLMFIGVAGDALTAYEETVDFHRRSPEPKELLTLRGITHHEMYQPQHLYGVLESVSGFLGRYLPGAP